MPWQQVSQRRSGAELPEVVFKKLHGVSYTSFPKFIVTPKLDFQFSSRKYKIGISAHKSAGGKRAGKAAALGRTSTRLRRNASGEKMNEIQYDRSGATLPALQGAASLIICLNLVMQTASDKESEHCVASTNIKLR